MEVRRTPLDCLVARFLSLAFYFPPFPVALSRCCLTGHRIHAYRDLKAYVCTTGREECEPNMFRDRDCWFSHELEHHHSLYMCKLCGSQYTDKKVLRQHLVDEHGPYSNEEILSIIEHGKLVPSQLKAQDCPFCDDWASILSHRRHQREGRTSSSIQHADILVSLTHFKRHVATHQEQLAIFAVPRTVDDDEERSHGAVEANSEAVSSKDDNLRITDQRAQTMEGSTPSQPCVYVTGLPRAVSEADIENHFRLGGFRGVTEVTLMEDFAFIQFEDPDDVRLAVASMHGSTLLDSRINVMPAQLSLDREMDVIDGPHADNFDYVRAIDEINATYSHFRTTLLPHSPEMVRIKAITQEELKAYQAQRFPDVPMAAESRDELAAFITSLSKEFTESRKAMGSWFYFFKDEARLRASVRAVGVNLFHSSFNIAC